jgi:ATP-binding cassette subfamily C protein
MSTGAAARVPTSTAWQRFIRPIASAHRREIGALACWSLIEALPALLAGLIVATAVDHGFLAGDVWFGLGGLGVYCLVLLVGTWATRHCTNITAGLVETLRDRLVSDVVRSCLRRAVETDRAVPGGEIALLTGQIEAARQVGASLLMALRTVLFTSAATIIGVSALVPTMAGVVLASIAVGAAALRLVTRSWRPRYRETLRAEEMLGDDSGAVFGALRDVAACGAEPRAAAELHHRAGECSRSITRLANASAGRIVVIAAGSRVPLIALLVMSPCSISSGALTAGEVLGAATYLMTGLEPALRMLAESIGNIGLEFSGLLQSLTIAADHPISSGRPADRLPCEGSDLEMRQVTFRYSDQAAPVLDAVSLRISEGEHLAVVGPSGAGKSTLASVLAGIHPPESGTVSVGGRAIAELERASLRRMIAFVPQEAYVFAGTVRENLAYLAPQADDQDIVAAAEAVGAGPLLAAVGGPGGTIGDPGLLSPGQRQHLVLVRVHLSAARVVILDEATCHLDPGIEMVAEQAFAARGGTLVVVAHRISSAVRAGRIVILDGETVQSGTHESLVRTSKTYAGLVGHWEVGAAEDGTTNGGENTGRPGRLTGPRPG